MKYKKMLLSEYLEPEGDGIEESIYKLRKVVGKLLAIAVVNKQLSLEDAQYLALGYRDSDVKLVKD